jgi:hypothetical protein
LHGTVIQYRPRTKKRTCKFPGCNKWARRKGVCGSHGAKRTCKFPGCNKWAQRKGVCVLHAPMMMK